MSQSKAGWNDARRKYTYNAGWRGKWTKSQEAEIRRLKQAGYGVHAITDALFELSAGKSDAPARWESDRDKLKEMLLGEHIKGDIDDPKAPREDDQTSKTESFEQLQIRCNFRPHRRDTEESLGYHGTVVGAGMRNLWRSSSLVIMSNAHDPVMECVHGEQKSENPGKQPVSIPVMGLLWCTK